MAFLPLSFGTTAFYRGQTMIYSRDLVPVAFQYHMPQAYITSKLFGRRGKTTDSGRGDSTKKKVKKENLPEKICMVCGRPFTWRKKWERSWDEVTCCSKSCNAKRRSGDF